MNTCGKRKQTVKHILYGAVIGFWVIVPCVILLGGIDIDPVDDKDLLLPENSVTYDPDGNGWTVLSNVMSQVESIHNELIYNETNYCPRSEAYILAKDKLSWYANPSNEEYYRVDCIVEQTTDCLSHFTNTIATCEYIGELLKTNEWVLEGIDSAIAAGRYSPPPVSMMTGDQFCLPVSEMITVNKSFLLARVRYEFDRGNYDAGVDAFRKALGWATLLQTKCGAFVDYLVGTTMIEDDVSCIGQIVADISLPKSTLSSLNDSLETLPGFTSEAMSHALKREYACAREYSQLAPADILYPEKSQLYKIVHSPLARYIYHPNRALRDLANRFRHLIDSDFQILELRYREKEWYDVCIPNCWGRIAQWYERDVSDAKEIEKKVGSLKTSITGMIVTNDNRTFASSYFPLILTNGCYYTHDLKHIVSVAKSSESIVVGGDVEIGEAADFGHVKKIIVKPECEGWLGTWYDALRDPTNLVDVCVGDDVAEIGKTGNLIYEQELGRIINIFGNQKSVTIPENLVVSDIYKFVEQLTSHDIRKLQFCGPLPDYSKCRTRDSYGRRIACWWKYGGWEYFKRIFEKKKTIPFLYRTPHGLIVTVSRQHADERTRQIVESGMWEGRPIRWSESNE